MSQARHAMGGPSHVSPLQYDSTMKALVRVGLDASTSDDDSEISSESEFKVYRVKPGCMDAQKASRLEKEEGVARRRKGEESVGIEDVPSMGQGGGCVEGEEAKDPIKWFGILVPQNLRRSQQCFVEGEDAKKFLVSVFNGATFMPPQQSTFVLSWQQHR